MLGLRQDEGIAHRLALTDADGPSRALPGEAQSPEIGEMLKCWWWTLEKRVLCVRVFDRLGLGSRLRVVLVLGLGLGFKG